MRGVYFILLAVVGDSRWSLKKKLCCRFFGESVDENSNKFVWLCLLTSAVSGSPWDAGSSRYSMTLITSPLRIYEFSRVNKQIRNWEGIKEFSEIKKIEIMVNKDS